MNPEQHAIDEIDELMAQACDEHGVPLDDYNNDRYVKCELCEQDWHGTVNELGCPGAWADDEQVAAYKTGVEINRSAAQLNDRTYPDLTSAAIAAMRRNPPLSSDSLGEYMVMLDGVPTRVMLRMTVTPPDLYASRSSFEVIAYPVGIQDLSAYHDLYGGGDTPSVAPPPDLL